MSTSSQPQPQQQNPEAEQPKSSTVADNLKSLNNQIRAKIVSDALKKGSIGAVTGAALSFLIFRRNQTINYAHNCNILCR